MSSYGVTSSGFVQKTTQDIIEEIETYLSTNLSAALNFQPTGVLGQLITAFASQEGESWQALLGIYNATYPDTASGLALDAVVSLTGILRLASAKSTVTLTVNLDAGTTLPVGRIVEVSQSGARFETTAAVTNGTGVPGNFTVAAESVEFGPVQGLAGTIDTIITPVSGWTANAGITNGTAETYALVDGQTLTVSVDGGGDQTATFNTADFALIGAATAAEVAAVIDADITGASAVAAGTFVRIESDTVGTGTSIQVTGGTANATLGFSTTAITAMNLLDAALGRLEETDEELRLRYNAGLRAQGKATVEAIRSGVREVVGVNDTFVFDNPTLLTVDGIPPKAFEVVVDQGTATDQAIYDAIWDLKPAGIEAHGDKTGSVTDSQGFSQTIKFSNPTDVDIFVEVDIETDSAVFGGGTVSEGITQVEEAMVAFVQGLIIGEDITAIKLKCEIVEVAGVTDLTDFKISRDSGPPTLDQNIVIAPREVADLQSVNITVNVV